MPTSGLVRIPFLLVLLLRAWAPGQEAAEDPVRVAGVELPPEVGPGSAFTAKVRVRIDPPFHIYDVKPDPNILPTTFKVKVSAKEALETAGDVVPDREPLEHQVTINGQSVTEYRYFEGEVVFSVPLLLKAGKPGEQAKVALEMEFMACTMDYCLAPATKPATGSLRIGAPPRFRFEPSPLEPGGTAELVIPLPAGVGMAGLTVPRKLVSIEGTSEVDPAGDGVIRADGGGLALRVPVEVTRNVSEEGPREFRGAAIVAGVKVPFFVRESIEVPLLGFLLIAAGAALIALLTPCVFPMIPITISFFTKQGEKSQRSPVGLGLIYCLGIVVSFTAIGAAFTLALGQTGASDFALHWLTNVVIGVLFIVFGLSLFGAFELQLPESVMNLVGRAQGRGGVVGIWLLGLLFAVTTFTCTAPFVGGLLAGAAASGQWTRPLLGMVVFSGVLAVPFFFLSAFPSKLKSLPRSGGWLNEVKVCMGFIEVMAAFKFLGGADMALKWDIFTRSFVLCVWAACALLMGLYLLGLFRLPHDAGPKEKVGVTALVIALISIGFALYLLRGLDGDPVDKNIETYLPVEFPERTPDGRRQILLRELQAAGGGAPVGAAQGPAVPSNGGTIGFARHYYKNDIDGAREAAVKLKKALFFNFTGRL